MPFIVETDNFFNEAVASFDSARGPVDAFVYSAEVKKQLLDYAVETGDIPVESFADCPIFDREEEKKARFEALRAKSILSTLETMDPVHLDLEHRIELEVAQAQVDTFVVVESARQLRLIETGVMESPYFEHAHDAEGHSIKGRTDFLREVLHEALNALYPDIDPAIMNFSLSLAAESIRAIKTDKLGDQAGDFVAAFQHQYGHMFERATESEPIILNAQKANEMREELERQFGEPFRTLRAEFGDINNARIVPIANRLLELLGDADKGWRAVENPDINGFKVVQHLSELQCGIRKNEITWGVFEELMVHEIGKHLRSAVKGRESGFEPLRMGLPEAGEAEEGVSTLFQKIWKGEHTFNTLDRDHYRYLTIAYAKGNMDGEKHTPDETFKFISSLMTANALSKNATGDDAAFQATQRTQRKAAFEHVFRTYRGMPPGEVMTKNASYLSGKLGAIKFVNGSPMSGSTLVKYLQCGKFDPNKEGDRQIVNDIWHMAA